MDCEGRQLLSQSPSRPVQCCPSTLTSTPVVVKAKRFRINGQIPLLPCRKYGQDAGVDIFAPCSIHTHPGERGLIYIRLECEFPEVEGVGPKINPIRRFVTV